jgi:transcriptional regulator with XRE-family HTH domain
MMTPQLPGQFRRATGRLDDVCNAHGRGMWDVPAIGVKPLVGEARTWIAGIADTGRMGNRPRITRRNIRRTPLAQRLVDLRLRANLTQVQLSVETGVSRGHIAKLESGGDVPGREALQALARFFHVTMDHLQNGTPLASNDAPLDPAEQEKEAILLRLWRRLHRHNREAVALLMESLIEGQSTDTLQREPSQPGDVAVTLKHL